MIVPNPWEASYPAALRNYRLDLSGLPPHPADFAREAAQAFGAAPAFTLVLPSGHRAQLTFAEVDALSDTLSAFFRDSLGLAPGDVIAIQLPNTLHYPVAVFGAWKAGLIATLVNPMYTASECERQLRDSGAKVLIVCDLFLTRSAAAVRACGVRLVLASLWDFFPAPVAEAVRAAMDGEAGAGLQTDLPHVRFMDAIAPRPVSSAPPGHRPAVVLFQYTGGTTGESKAAAITAANILSAMQMIADYLRAHDNAVAGGTTLTVLPLYHIFAFVLGFLLYFRAGSHNVLIANPRPLSNVRPAFDGFPIDWMAGVDTLYAGLLAEPWFRAKPPRLRFALAGGTATRPSTAAAWEALVGPLVEGYGLTESTCIVASNPPGAGRRMGSVGLPLPGCTIRIVDDEGRDCAIGRPGELLVSGPQIVGGYRGAPEVDGDAFVDGWFRTGDIAVMDEAGYLTLVDRKKDIVLVSGFNVYPNEVEAVIAAHPAVVEAAVIGLGDARTGEALRAFVVTRDPALSGEAVIAHCRDHLAAYKTPKDIVFLDALPKSPVGKILRAKLRS